MPARGMRSEGLSSLPSESETKRVGDTTNTSRPLACVPSPREFVSDHREASCAFAARVLSARLSRRVLGGIGGDFLVPASRQTPQKFAWCTPRSPMTRPGAASDANLIREARPFGDSWRRINAVASNQRIREATMGSARMSARIPMLDRGRRVSR